MDGKSLVSLLRSCKDLKSLRQAKLTHQKIVTSGLENNFIFCKNLINLYVSCQDVDSARLVFNTIKNPLDITIWNVLISAYTKNYMFNEAIRLFDRLVKYDYPTPDFYTYPGVLKACSGLGRVKYGEMIHTHVVKNGLLLDVVVGSSVISMYAKCGMFEKALKVFDEMPERDVACWNTMVSGYYQNGQCEKALDVFEKMKDLGYKPDSVTYTTAISSCARLLDLGRGERIYEEMVRNGFLLDGFVTAALVDMYGKCGCIEKAEEVFEQISEKGLVSWNSMVAGYSLRGDSKSCIELLLRMKEEKVKPNCTTLSSLLMACSKSTQLWHGKLIHGYMIRHNVETDIFVDTSLVDMYFKCGSVTSAETVFSMMPKAYVVAWNVMISGYVSVGCYFEALGIFEDMKKAGVEVDAVTCTSALAACSQLAALEQGKEIHKSIIDHNLESNEIVMGALLDMYAKCGAVNEARGIFNKLPKRDLVSWTSMIVACGSHGQAFEAVNLFSRMLESNVKPDRVTFLAVISACSHAGLIDEGCHYFKLMVTDYGIQLTVEDYSCFIDLLARAGRLHEAYFTLQRAPSIRENVELLSTLLSACHMHGELELGEEIARTLVEKDSIDTSTYVILAKVFACLRKWDEVQKVRLKMKDLGLRKYPGCSWIEIDKRIHQFLVEDKLFPQAEMVYECLSMMAIHMEKDEMLQDWDCCPLVSLGANY